LSVLEDVGRTPHIEAPGRLYGILQKEAVSARGER